MAKILILIGAHLCTAPRPQKEAAALAQAGHDVTVGGVWFDPTLVERDRLLMADLPYTFTPILDFRPEHPERVGVRLQARLARAAFRRLGLFSPALLGYGTRSLLRFALKEQADLTIVHSEAGLWVGDRLLQKGLQVGVDFEDWFSHDLLPEARATRPIAHLKKLEERLIRTCKYCLTTSNAMATALAQFYQAPRPTVVYNTFPPVLTQIDHRLDQQSIPKVHWFSQNIGRGRGLEALLQALPLLKRSVEVHLRGNCTDTTRQWLEELTPPDWRSRLFIHPTVPNHELPVRIAENDIGLALEQSDPPNHDLTVSNKLFQYLQAGLAVIATNTAGQREVMAQCPKAGHLTPCDDSVALARAINALIMDPMALRSAKIAALQAAQEQFCWEKQRDRLLQAIDRAL
ncbi:glycosyl transferase family 1 [Leptolyngbya sp. 'hensonii']|uniref:glycosyltransferase n=1 Tax=Leptolyngbya sp. 'hensonii' TaxID=1922337 RepID=UPI00094FEB10|nr:glycosyltransferase [Leptolyngbya sp. 'hensonii']OLP17819.1 glycosyl transferase family 1 [Leptolyngbya sp. 'hensonii']